MIVDANLAQVPASTGDDLEAVALDQRDASVLRDEHAAVIDVADHAPVLVELGEGARDVGGGADQEAPVGALEPLKATLRAVKLVDVLLAVSRWFAANPQ